VHPANYRSIGTQTGDPAPALARDETVDNGDMGDDNLGLAVDVDDTSAVAGNEGVDVSDDENVDKDLDLNVEDEAANDADDTAMYNDDTENVDDKAANDADNEDTDMCAEDTEDTEDASNENSDDSETVIITNNSNVNLPSKAAAEANHRQSPGNEDELVSALAANDNAENLPTEVAASPPNDDLQILDNPVNPSARYQSRVDLLNGLARVAMYGNVYTSHHDFDNRERYLSAVVPGTMNAFDNKGNWSETEEDVKMVDIPLFNDLYDSLGPGHFCCATYSHLHYIITLD
jgi:hypothetical protein